MINLLLGAGALAGLWWLARVAASVSPAAAARLVKRVGGVAALAVAALLLLRGRIDMAALAGSAGAWLLGWGGLAMPAWARRTGRTAGATSRVRSAMVEMELDHDTGAIRGTVLAGRHAGQALDALDEAALLGLRSACLAADPDGARLLEAYLDRRFPAWREGAEADPHPGRGADPQGGAMTQEEAYQILGLQRGAGPDDVRRAHRTLMKKLHPDQGGSDYLAARVNAAKDLLSNRHR